MLYDALQNCFDSNFKEEVVNEEDEEVEEGEEEEEEEEETGNEHEEDLETDEAKGGADITGPGVVVATQRVAHAVGGGEEVNTRVSAVSANQSAANAAVPGNNHISTVCMI